MCLFFSAQLIDFNKCNLCTVFVKALKCLLSSQTWSGNSTRTCKCELCVKSCTKVERCKIKCPVEGGKETFVSSGSSWTRLRTKSWRRKSCWRTFSLTTRKLVSLIFPNMTPLLQQCINTQQHNMTEVKPHDFLIGSKPWSWMSWWLLWRRRMTTWGPWKRGTKCTWRKLATWVLR